MSSIKLSVCIPIYGVEKYIERCARSLFEQTIKDGIEFIFVNDCTKDKSLEILEAVLKEYPDRKNQVKIIHHAKNGGLVAARNTGLKHASGDYIIHCDSDDWVDVTMYETMFRQAVDKDADMVYCDYFLAEEKCKKLVNKTGTCDSEKLLIELLCRTDNRNLWDKMVKREIALASDLYCPEHFVMGEDLLRVLQMLKKCKKVVHIAAPLYYYRYNMLSISKGKWKKETLKNFQAIIPVLSQLFPEKKNFSAINCFQCSILLSMIRHPEATNSKEFCTYINEIGTQNIADGIKYLPKMRQLLLKLAQCNYKLACFLYSIFLFCTIILHRLKRK